MKRGVVLFSGGLDSLATLMIAREECSEVVALHFDYGQKNSSAELVSVQTICKKLGVELVCIPLDFMKSVVKTAYTSDETIEFGEPDIFVPNRNMMFISIAHAYCQTNKFDTLYCGLFGDNEYADLDKPVLKEDRIHAEYIKVRYRQELEIKIFPDSGDYFIRIIAPFMKSQSGTAIEVKFPLFGKSKSYAFEVLDKANFLEEAKYSSISCYNGTNNKKHRWGIGCGDCTPCYSKHLAWMVYKYKKSKYES